MKTRTYTLITGNYENTHVVGRIVGPAVPALSTLLKRFKEKYKYPKDDNHYLPTYFSTIEKRFEAVDRMKADGLVGWDLAELFIHWCIREHNFKSIDKDVFYL